MSQSIPRGQDSIAVDVPADAPAVIGELVELVQDQQEQITELQQEVADLRAGQDNHQEQTARQRAEDRQRITDLEDRVEDVEDGGRPQGSDTEDGPADGHQQPQTPIEQTVGLPQEVIDQETANVRRAVFVAQDVHDYTTSVPAGRVISAGDLGRVLRAGTDCRGHSQTVDRVIGILDRMGGDGVEVVERRGERRVVFSEDLARRLETVGHGGPAGSHGVVTGGTV